MAYVETWDETAPDGSIVRISGLDDWQRQAKRAIRERLEGDAANGLTGIYDSFSAGTIKLGSARIAADTAANIAGYPLQNGRMFIATDTHKLYHLAGAGAVEIGYASSTSPTFTGLVSTTGVAAAGGFRHTDSAVTVQLWATNAGPVGVVGTISNHGLVIATNSTTVATFGTNGSLSVTGTIQTTGGSIAAGSFYKDATLGLTLAGVAGSADDFYLVTPAGAGILHVPTGTRSLVVDSGTFLGPRLIGGTDIAAAAMYGVFSDGTAPANNAYAVGNVLGHLVSKSSALASGTQVTSEVYHIQTVANSGSVISHFSYINAAHTSGVTPILLANVASVEATGNGGTTTTMGCYRTQALMGAGSIVTTLSLVDVRSPGGTGTVATLVGVDIQSMTFATTTNYAIRTRINDSTFNGTGGNVSTSATNGFLFIPSCAGTPTGVPANAATGHIPLIYDATNDFLYIFRGGGWKKSTIYA